MLSGLCACLLQSNPGISNMQLFGFLKQSADRFSNPDNLYGYGIPNGVLAFTLMNGYAPSASHGKLELNWSGIGLYPNPANEEFSLLVDNGDELRPFTVRISDLSGKVIFEKEVPGYPFYNIFTFSRSGNLPGIENGIYFVSVWGEAKREKLFAGKLVFAD